MFRSLNLSSFNISFNAGRPDPGAGERKAGGERQGSAGRRRGAGAALQRARADSSSSNPEQAAGGVASSR